MISECTEKKPLFIFSSFYSFVKPSFILVCRYFLPRITSNMARSFVHAVMQNYDLTDEENLLRYFTYSTGTEEKPPSSPAAALLYVSTLFLSFKYPHSDLHSCFFSPAEEPEPTWMNANTAFYMLKMLHPVTVHAAPPEKAARMHISRKYESHCLSLWCGNQKKLWKRLVLGKLFIQIYKTHILYLGITSTLTFCVPNEYIKTFLFEKYL